MSIDRRDGNQQAPSLRAGTTIIEALVVVFLLVLLFGPIFLVFRSGSQTALKGIVTSDITVEARVLLRQVHDDLHSSVFYIDYARPIRETTDEYFDKIVSSSNGVMFTLLRFPPHGSVDDAINTSGGAAHRRAVRIIYELKRLPSGLYRFLRQEGNTPPKELSSRVTFFEIRENPAAPPKTTWLVSLQLADLSRAPASHRLPGSTLSGAPPVHDTLGQRLTGRTPNIQIADFFTVVASEYFTRFRRSRAIPNWHTLIDNP